MKISIIKIISIICITFLLVIIFNLGIVPLIEGKNIVDPYVDTKFARNFSPEKFKKIKIGMTIDEATKIIGEPLYKEQGYIDSLNISYHFTSDGKLLDSSKKLKQNYYEDFAWYRSSFEVDKNNRIVDINKGWSYD